MKLQVEMYLHHLDNIRAMLALNDGHSSRDVIYLEDTGRALRFERWLSTGGAVVEVPAWDYTNGPNRETLPPLEIPARELSSALKGVDRASFVFVDDGPGRVLVVSPSNLPSIRIEVKTGGIAPRDLGEVVASVAVPVPVLKDAVKTVLKIGKRGQSTSRRFPIAIERHAQDAEVRFIGCDGVAAAVSASLPTDGFSWGSAPVIPVDHERLALFTKNPKPVAFPLKFSLTDKDYTVMERCGLWTWKQVSGFTFPYAQFLEKTPLEGAALGTAGVQQTVARVKALLPHAERTFSQEPYTVPVRVTEDGGIEFPLDSIKGVTWINGKLLMESVQNIRGEFILAIQPPKGPDDIADPIRIEAKAKPYQDGGLYHLLMPTAIFAGAAKRWVSP